MSAPEIAGLIDEARLRGTAVKLAATVRSAGVTTAITYEVRVGTSICENAALVSNSKSTRIKLDENAASRGDMGEYHRIHESKSFAQTAYVPDGRRRLALLRAPFAGDGSAIIRSTVSMATSRPTSPAICCTSRKAAAFRSVLTHSQTAGDYYACPSRRNLGLFPVESPPMRNSAPIDPVLGRGVYGAPEALRLINFRRQYEYSSSTISRQTVARWLRGYDYVRDGVKHHSAPLWEPDYTNEDDTIELSFRDLIEVRFVKAFRDLGLGLPTIRECFARAVEEVKDKRPFSTSKFRTDGKTIFLEIIDGVREGELLDLKRRQGAFHRFVAPSLHDLEFDADIVARWYPLGKAHKIVIDPARAFGRPIVVSGGVPTEVLRDAVEAEGSEEKVARSYAVPLGAVREAVAFQQRLAA
jgi:uncharacterized protein (DUF433 family)